MTRLFTLLSCFIYFIPSVYAQKVNCGFIDVSQVDFMKQSPIPLDGKWHFHFGEFLNDDQVKALSKIDTSFLEVPGIWQNYMLEEKKVGGQGFATYWLNVRLPEDFRGLAIKITDASSAYRIFINDHLVSVVGQIGTDKSHTIPNSISHVIPIKTDNRDITIRIQISNFHYRVGGLWESILIGDETKLQTQRYQVTMRTVLISGIAFAFMVYHLGLYFIRKKNRTSLYFSIFCLVVLVRMYVAENMILLDFFPNFPWFWRIRLDVITFYLSVPCALLFTKSLFPDEFPQKMANIILAIGFTIAGICLITPATIYSQFIPFYRFFAIFIFLFFIYGIVKALKNKTQGAKTFLVGYVVIVTCAINDILFAANVIKSIDLVPFGLVVLLSVKSFVLSRQFANAFYQTELLSDELAQINQNLEHKVQERTKEIEEKKKDLEHKNYALVTSEEELKQNTEELTRINESLEKANRDIENMLTQEQQNLKKLKDTQVKLVQAEKMAGLGQMTAGIAHEINNPINFVTGGVQSLKVSLTEILEILSQYEELYKLPVEKISEEITKIHELEVELSIVEAKDDVMALIDDIEMGAHRATQIIRSLRLFSRLDQNELRLANIHEGIDSTLTILRNRYKSRIEVIKNYDSNMPDFYCYPGQLNQVFMNILANAIEAIQGNGTIEITTNNLKEQVIIVFADSGTGIPDHIKNKIFDPFFTTKDVGKGTGLGLSISYGIIEEHNGQLEVMSTEGKGTTFVITLPKPLI